MKPKKTNYRFSFISISKVLLKSKDELRLTWIVRWFWPFIKSLSDLFSPPLLFKPRKFSFKLKVDGKEASPNIKNQVRNALNMICFQVCQYFFSLHSFITFLFFDFELVKLCRSHSKLFGNRKVGISESWNVSVNYLWFGLGNVKASSVEEV